MSHITATVPQQHPTSATWVALVQPTRDEIIRAGERALSELPTTTEEQWNRWMQVAAALDAIRTEAMFIAQTNTPDGHNKKYQRALADLIKRHGFDQLDKGTRSRLIECLHHRTEIESWLAELATDQRLKFSHPVVILRHWRAATTTPNPNAVKRPSTIGELKERIAELERQLAQLRNSDGGTLTAKDFPRETVRLLRGLHNQRKLAEIRRLLEAEGK